MGGPSFDAVEGWGFCSCLFPHFYFLDSRWLGDRSQGRPQLAGGEGVEGAEAAGEFVGVQVALAVEPAEKIVGGLFSFQQIAFYITRDQVAVGTAPQPRPRYDVVQALHRRRGPAPTVKELAALERVDGLSQRRVQQKVCLLNVNRRSAAGTAFLGRGPV